MIAEPEGRLDKRAVSYWRVTGALGSLFVWALPVASYLTNVYWQWPLWPVLPLALLALADTVLEAFVLPSLRWNTWRYAVTPESIAIAKGILVRHHTIVPMVRIQHVDTEQGPFLRHYGLSSVKVSTAAGTHDIPALADDMAVALRDRISELARVVEEDV